MKIVIGSDHAGFSLKETVIAHLKENNFEVIDKGTFDTSSCNYPEIASDVAKGIIAKEGELGILICGTGVGISIAANKFKGIRACVCSDIFSAKYTRMHNDANILCFGERVVGPGLALELVDVFLKTEYEGGRHALRVDMISQIENENFK